MLRKLLLILLLQSVCFAQTPDRVEKHYFKNGSLKYLITHTGTDTLQFIRYHSNGNMKDSAWIYAPGRKEIPFGTQKSWYHNGNLLSITFSDTKTNKSTSYSYRRNGKLYSFYESPGVYMRYNKKGKIIKRLDQNKGDQVAIPKNFRKGRSLINSPLKSKIAQRRAYLHGQKKSVKLISGVLISIRLKKDTLLLSHCSIEGFFTDSMVVSKFDYDRSESKRTLKHDSTFLLAFKEIDGIEYTRKNTYTRYCTALICEITGVDLIFIPLILAPIVDGISAFVEPIVLEFAASGIPPYILGRLLFRTMVPKNYDLKDWSISLKK